jgi:hypothetical protein
VAPGEDQKNGKVIFMNNIDFDRKIKGLVDSYEEPLGVDLWSGIEAGLERRSAAIWTRRVSYAAVAASVVIALVLGINSKQENFTPRGAMAIEVVQPARLDMDVEVPHLLAKLNVAERPQLVKSAMGETVVDEVNTLGTNVAEATENVPPVAVSQANVPVSSPAEEVGETAAGTVWDESWIYEEEEAKCKECDAHKKKMYLTVNYFMKTLIDRTDRVARVNNINAYVPFCDYRLVEYLYNIPFEYKCYLNIEKGLLRYAYKDILPKEIINRKKSPYPKTYNPKYTNKVKEKLSDIINKNDSKIIQVLDKEYILNVIKRNGENFENPWFGQLMKGPQFMAYLIQLEYWLEEYNIRFIM